MDAFQIHYSPAARDDLAEIDDYIFNATLNPVIPKQFIDRILVRCNKLCDAPYAGRARNDLAEGICTIPFEKSTIIVYRVVGSTIEITNVFYGGRDVDTFIRSSKAKH